MNETGHRKRARGFTLLELMLSVGILALISSVTYMVFAVVIGGWRIGMAMTDTLNHGDYVMEQLVLGLRSAYYPDGRGTDPVYGFWHEDAGGGGPGASDAISWVKMGEALVGGDAPFAGSPHRVRFAVEDVDGIEGGAATAWQVVALPEDFDSDEVPVQLLSDRVIGFNCRAAYRQVDDEIDWEDEWAHTNRLPSAVELTLYLEPPQSGDPPLEIKRVIGIPVAPLSWR